MRVIVVIEHDRSTVSIGSLSAVTFARSLAGPDGQVELLVLGEGVDAAAADASRYAPVVVGDDPALGSIVADRYAKVIADTARERGAEVVVAASTSFAKDIVSRAAGLMGGAMASDVVGHDVSGDEILFRRPMFAGAITATVALADLPWIITVRSSAYEAAEPLSAPGSISPLTIDATALPNLIEVEQVQSKTGGRPDVTEARVVVSGGRAFPTTEAFEQYVGSLADKLGGAAGSSRVLVDAGIAPNELQVGQTGKIVAPELYIALGISGAVQHLAGMKNSKTIVAINNDREAPIFAVANYGLVGDVFEIVPEMISKL